ncbi:MAG: N-acetyltransferase [Gemmatimonadetes bacterium]|nr:N-acetyltransferase [Gemmatimonadota bacterium]
MTPEARPAAPVIRAATRADAAAVAEIYRPIVTDTPISFELEPPGAAEMAERIENVSETHVWLVAEADGGLAGYAYGTAHRARPAYRFATETAVYISAAHRGRGIARQLYDALFPRLAARGYYNAYAGVVVPNDASEALHRAVGFKRIGVFPAVGYKFGEWHDVSWWHRKLRNDSP